MILKREIGWRQLDLLATIPIFLAGSALHFACSPSALTGQFEVIV